MTWSWRASKLNIIDCCWSAVIEMTVQRRKKTALNQPYNGKT
jgi:hypothetical protein